MDNAILLLEQKKQNRTVKVKIKKGYAVYDKSGRYLELEL